MPSIGSLCVGSFYSFIFYVTALLKSEIFGTQKPKASQVLDLLGWEEEWSEYRELYLNNLLI